MNRKVILASQSPRRRELLQHVFPTFDVTPSMVEEFPLKGESPRDYVKRNSMLKARDVRNNGPVPTAEQTIYIGSDTVVTIEGEILEKPQDRSHARSMLESLSGKVHSVWSGVYVLIVDRSGFEQGKGIEVETKVTFRNLKDDELNAYLDTDEPYDKAGSYAAQGKGSSFVKSLEGSYTNVVGLPLAQLKELLEEMGI